VPYNQIIPVVLLCSVTWILGTAFTSIVESYLNHINTKSLSYMELYGSLPRFFNLLGVSPECYSG